MESIYENTSAGGYEVPCDVVDDLGAFYEDPESLTGQYASHIPSPPELPAPRFPTKSHSSCSSSSSSSSSSSEGEEGDINSRVELWNKQVERDNSVKDRRGGDESGEKKKEERKTSDVGLATDQDRVEVPRRSSSLSSSSSSSSSSSEGKEEEKPNAKGPEIILYAKVGGPRLWGRNQRCLPMAVVPMCGATHLLVLLCFKHAPFHFVFIYWSSSSSSCDLEVFFNVLIQGPYVPLNILETKLFILIFLFQRSEGLKCSAV